MHNDISPEGYSSPLLPLTPQKQVEVANSERDETLSQLPLLKTVLTRLDKRLAETDSNKVTRQLAEKYSLSGENAMALQEIVHDILNKEKGYIETRIKRAKP